MFDIIFLFFEMKKSISVEMFSSRKGKIIAVHNIFSAIFFEYRKVYFFSFTTLPNYQNELKMCVLFKTRKFSKYFIHNPSVIVYGKYIKIITYSLDLILSTTVFPAHNDSGTLSENQGAVIIYVIYVGGLVIIYPGVKLINFILSN